MYVTWGGLRATIFNEVLRFFLIVMGLFPLSIMTLSAVEGLNGLSARIGRDSIELD